MTLLPAFQAGDNVLRKADIIFEKEQDYLLENAGRKTQQSAELYVNDDGYVDHDIIKVLFRNYYETDSSLKRDRMFTAQRFINQCRRLSQGFLKTRSLARRGFGLHHALH